MQNPVATMKIRLSFLGIVVLFIAFSLVALNRMNALNQKSTAMEVNWLPSLVKINSIAGGISDYRIAELLHVSSTNSQEMEEYDREMARLTQEVANLKTEYEPLISSPEERAVYQEFSRKYEDYLNASKIALEHSRKNENMQAAAQLKKSGILYNSFYGDLEKLIAINEQGGFTVSKDGNQLFAEAQTVFVGIDVAVAIIIFILMFLVEGWSAETITATQWLAAPDAKKMAQASFLNQLTIKNKLQGAFLGLAVLFTVFAWLALNRMNFINAKSTEIEINWLPSVVSINAVNTMTSDMRIAEALHVLSTDPAEIMAHDKELENLKAEIARQLKLYEPLISSEEERRIYQDFSAKYKEYLTASDKMLTLSRQNKNEESALQLKQSSIVFNDMSVELLKLVELNTLGAKTASHEGDRLYQLSTTILISASICIFILAILLMIASERTISRPLGQLTGIIQKIAGGNTSVTHEFHDRYDEVGYIAQAVTSITTTLENLVKDSSELISSAQAGMLSARVESSRHPGEFGMIISGMNSLLEILSKPLVEVAEVMQQLALGNLKGRIEGAYEGDLRALKANVNRSLDSLVSLLTELGEITHSMAMGDLSRSIHGNYQGEFAGLKSNFNQALQQMKEILTVVVSNTEHIATASTQTVAAANHVSEQSSKQLSSLDEVASAITESSAAITQVADNTKKGGELATSTADLATTGREQLIKLIEMIERIADEYKRIEQITSKINRVADKTHLLSLNAGLEAVRPGNMVWVLVSLPNKLVN